jgi:hypothetical protein
MLRLVCHPKTPAEYIEAIAVRYDISPEGRLSLRYYIKVPEQKLVFGENKSSLRADGLWKTTCFEAFLAKGEESKYIELNFAPSSQWAAYWFDGYRQGGMDLALDAAPDIHFYVNDSHFVLEAFIDLPFEWQHGPFHLGVTVVAEELGGIKSYWAVNHNNPDPDFHDRSCFTLHLEAAEQA